MSTQIDPNIAHLILAAGASTRMQRPKQLLPWNDTTFIGHSIERTSTLSDLKTFVILGSNARIIQDKIRPYPVTTFFNPDWQSGMGATISFGVRQILKYEIPFEAVLISLVDQPLLTTGHFYQLIEKFKVNKKKIVVSDLGGVHGVPAIFPNIYFKQLIELKANIGAKKIIKALKKEVVIISANGQGIDVDTPEQFRDLKQKFCK